MTHGDKAKAKTGKSSQASVKKSSSSPVEQAAGKGVEGKGGGKVAPPGAAKGSSESDKGSKISIKKAGAEKGGNSGKEGGTTRGRSREEEPGLFSNPALAAAFRHAIEKYPNAFRKLTD